MHQKRILFLTNRVPYPLKDGGNLAMRTMIDGYIAAGWKVFLLTMNTTRHTVAESVIEKEFAYLDGCVSVSVDNRITLKRMFVNHFFSREPEHVSRFYTQEYADKLEEVLQQFKPDVIQVESVYLTSYLPRIRGLSNAVLVLRMHNVEYQIWQGMAGKTKNVLKAAYLERLAERIRNYERNAWHDYDLLLTITERDAGLVYRLEDSANLIVAPFGINTSGISMADNEQWVGYHIGAMDWLPNQQGMRWFLHKVWPGIRKMCPTFQFHFAGRGMSADFMNTKLKGVHCEGEVEDADKFINDKKILIVPLLSGGGIRVKILEAMARGKVVITTSKGIKGIEAKPDEHYLRAGSPDEFAKCVKWCLENKAKAEKLAENARQLILEKYEQDTVMQQVIAALDPLLTQRHS